MKEGWKMVKLGDVCELKNGRGFKKTEWSATGLPIIRIQNLNNPEAPFNYFNGAYDPDIEINFGDLLFSWSGTVGSSFGPHLWVRDRALLNQHIFKVNLRRTIDRRFAFYLLLELTAEIEKGVRGAVGLAHVTKGQLLSMKFPLPPLEEQRRIVAFLDEAFAAIETARRNTERNLENAKDLFEGYLERVFDQHKEISISIPSTATGPIEENSRHQQRAAKGRDATERQIQGDLSLCVGPPQMRPRAGWRWTPLVDLANLESGHTPSRSHPEYWDGNIPWIGIKDAKRFHRGRITETLQHTNELGLQNSSARLLPANTVCLSRTASVGYVTIMDKPMATSQDFVNWVCGPELDPEFLMYLFVAEGDGFAKYSMGAIHQTIYFPEVKAFQICHPDIRTQRAIVEHLQRLEAEAARIKALYTQKELLTNTLRAATLQHALQGPISTPPSVQTG